MKKLVSSKTIWFNALGALSASTDMVQEYLTDGSISGNDTILLITFIANIALRFKTKQPIKKPFHARTV